MLCLMENCGVSRDEVIGNILIRGISHDVFCLQLNLYFFYLFVFFYVYYFAGYKIISEQKQ